MNGEKKTVSVTVRMTEDLGMFADKRTKQLGFESDCAYIRDLISKDRKAAVYELNLVADALGAKVIMENSDFFESGRQ